MDKKTKIILTVISIIMIIVAIVIVVTKSVPPTSSTDIINSNYNDTTVDNLRFTNANLVSNELTVYVQNTKSTDYELKTITVTFKDESGNKIFSIDSYIGEKISPNEIRTLDVKTDVDLSSTKTIEYTVNK